MGSLPLSRQGRAIIAFLNNGERLPLPFADDVRKLFSRVNEEKEFVSIFGILLPCRWYKAHLIYSSF